jgi:hypothetical protein
MNRLTVGAHVIEDAKRELIEKLKSNIDLDRIKAVCRDQHGMEMLDGINFKHGDIISHNGKVAFKLDFEIHFTLPVMIDEEGNYVEALSQNADEPSTPEERIDEAGIQAAARYSQF